VVNVMLDPGDLSLRQLLSWLTTPAQCGVYLSVADLARIGAGLGVTVGPLSRRMALEQLIRGAAIDERVPELLAALAAEFEAQRDAYLACGNAALDVWVERAAQGQATILALGETWRTEFGAG
jgi:hypothetical protein